MCGIAGIVREAGVRADGAIIRAMTRRLIHRGPDEEGYFTGAEAALGIRRLSIIDITNGRQPMATPDGRFQLVFNGEIYNYRELRTRLEPDWNFRTQSDTEVLLAAFARWGPGCLSLLNGMFAFAVWDTREKTLILARDRLGVKPCYYTFLEDGTFIFASEIKALQAYPGFRPRLNPQALEQLLTVGFPVCPQTFLKGVEQVLPGHYLRVTLEQLTSHAYWDLDPTLPKENLTHEAFSDGLQTALERAVKRRLAADVPVAAYLSGGIDSSAVTGLYSQAAGVPVHTFSLGFKDPSVDETGFARTVAQAFHCRHTEVPCRTRVDDYAKLVYHLEDPLVTLLHLPLFILSRAVNDAGFKVVLTGDGADEFLGGYRYFREMKMVRFMNRFPESLSRRRLLERLYPETTDGAALEERRRFLLWQAARNPSRCPHLPYGFHMLKDPASLLTEELRESFTGELPMPFPEERLRGLSPMDQVFYLEMKYRLCNMTLPLSDKMSMAHGVEARSPFLDYELVEFLNRVPSSVKILGLKEKFLLKKSMRSLLPAGIVARPKQPLTAPPGEFLGALTEPVRHYLGEKVVREKGYFQWSRVSHLANEGNVPRGSGDESLALMVFMIHLWDDLFLRQTHPSPPAL